MHLAWPLVAWGFLTVHAYCDGRQFSNSSTASHAQSVTFLSHSPAPSLFRELLAAFAGVEVDRMIESRGMTGVDAGALTKLLSAQAP
jgi:hypothetical protein